MTPSACLGAILLITLIIIAFFAWRRRAAKAGERSRFTLATPATPLAREAVDGLFASLRRVIEVGRAFEDIAARAGNATPVAGARLSAGQVVAVFDRTERALRAAPPTYANYLAVYRGLTSTDTALLSAADAYVAAGQQVHQALARSSPVGLPGAAPPLSDVDLANCLIELGRQVRAVVGAVHRLGVALDVE